MGEPQPDSPIDLGPEALLARVQVLAKSVSKGEPRNVVLGDLLDALLEGHVFPSPPAAWRARLALRQRVITLTEAIPALTFCEGDA
jgi:hypothetical protein